MNRINHIVLALCFAIMAIVTSAHAQAPQFSLAPSEYPSWSTFILADAEGIIDGAAGKQSALEQKWNVDIILKEAEYDPCLQMYGAGTVDAVCITNIDILPIASSRKSVAIMATSTSYGGDALLVDKNQYPDLASLRGQDVFGLDNSVSEYVFYRIVQQNGADPKEFKFTMMDPGAAAAAMQTGRKPAIMVWNPFVLDTLNKRADVKVLGDSRSCPGEVLDMVVVADEALKREGGDRFAMAVMEVFYTICDRMEDPTTKSDTLIGLGEKFSNLDLGSMRTVVNQTRFYMTPSQNIELLTNGTAFPGGGVETDGNLEAIMGRVTAFCVEQEMVETAPSIGYGSAADA